MPWSEFRQPRSPGLVSGARGAYLRSGLADAQVEERLRKVGMDVRASSPEEMRAMVASQIAKWKQVVADAGIPQQ